MVLMRCQLVWNFFTICKKAITNPRRIRTVGRIPDINLYKKSVYHFLSTIRPSPTAPSITHIPTGDAGVGVAVGQGVGGVFRVVTLVVAVVVMSVGIVTGTVVVTDCA